VVIFCNIAFTLSSEKKYNLAENFEISRTKKKEKKKQGLEYQIDFLCAILSSY